MADKTPKDASLQSTKQMLDELDALMERMLSVPVDEMGDTLTLPDDPPKGPSMAASLTLLEPPPPDPTDAPMAKTSPAVSTISAPAGKKPLERRPRSRLPLPPNKPTRLSKPAMKIAEEEAIELPVPTAEPEPLTNDVVPASVVPEIEPLVDEEDEFDAPARRRSGGTLLSINQSFDAATMYLGSLGRVLRGPAGRGVIGLTGLALLGFATVWVLKDWYGWNW